MLQFLADERVDVLDQTPSQLRLLVDAGLLDSPAPHPGTVLVGGEAIDPALWDRLAASSRRFFNLYGPTECTVDAVACRVQRRAQPVLGWPLANVQVHVLDAALEPVAIGAVGELVIGGAGVGDGYVGAPDADSARFRPDHLTGAPEARLYRTGDVVRRRADGALEYIGRADQQIKLRGHRIEPAEIEAAVRSHAAVREAVVVLGKMSGAPALVAYVVPASGQRPSPRALQDHAITRLPAYMVPAAFVLLEALPLTANGKLDRAALPAPSPADPLAGSSTPPADPVEIRLAQAFAEVLQVERVGLRDDFFMMGGNSLMLPRLAARIHALVQVKLPLRLLFRHSTVQALAAHIATLNAPAREVGAP
jgi:acyl-coenzyme A synthetase/AMP-(fatty) acid ligase